MEIPKPDKSVWEGPYLGGVTQSILIRFLQCPFKFYLHYYCGLKSPGEPQENLVFGDIMHVGLEHLITRRDYDFAKEMMYIHIIKQYKKQVPDHLFPLLCEMISLYDLTYLDTLTDIKTEQEINQPYYIESINTAIKIRGKKDVSASNMICDHKCKGYTEPLSTLNELKRDLQMNLYAAASGYVTEWYYDLIKIPDVNGFSFPPLKAAESNDAWMHRAFHQYSNIKWNYPIAQNKNHWVTQLGPIHQPYESCRNFMLTTFDPICRRLLRWWEHVTSPTFDPNNPECYNDIFYVQPIRMFDPAMTNSFKGDYYGLLTEEYDFDSLVPTTTLYPELNNE